MGKENIVTIKGGQYRYHYNPETRKTKYLGPVGSSPPISEEEFMAEIMSGEQLEKEIKRAKGRNSPPSVYIDILGRAGVSDKEIEQILSNKIEDMMVEGEWIGPQSTGLNLQMRVEKGGQKKSIYIPPLYDVEIDIVRSGSMRTHARKDWMKVIGMNGPEGAPGRAVIIIEADTDSPGWKVKFDEPNGIDTFIKRAKQFAGL